jgi:hypothetical protein
MHRAAHLATIACMLAAQAVAAGVRWEATIEIARGAGERGPWQQNASRYDFVDDPAVAFGPDGTLAVAWVDQRRRDVFVQTFGSAASAVPAAASRAAADTPSRAPVNVSRDARVFSWLPRLAWAPDDRQRLHVLWQEIIFSGGSHGGEIVHAVSHDGGRSFGPPQNLSRSRPGDGKGRLDRDSWHNGSLDIVAAPGGLVLAAWTEYDGPLWVARSSDGGRRFDAPRRVAGAPPDAPARAPALAVGPDGRVALAWTTGEDAAADILLALSPDGGRHFDPPRPVRRTSGHSDAPKLAFGPGGVLHVVHGETAGASMAIHHLRSPDGGRTFGTASDVSAPLAGGYPSLGVDGRGRVVVTWELLHATPPSPHGLGIAVAADGRRFGPAQVVPGSADPGGGHNGSTQGLLMRKLALREDGEIALVNSAIVPGRGSRVWLLRGRLD